MQTATIYPAWLGGTVPRVVVAVPGKPAAEIVGPRDPGLPQRVRLQSWWVDNAGRRTEAEIILPDGNVLVLAAHRVRELPPEPPSPLASQTARFGGAIAGCIVLGIVIVVGLIHAVAGGAR